MGKAAVAVALADEFQARDLGAGWSGRRAEPTPITYRSIRSAALRPMRLVRRALQGHPCAGRTSRTGTMLHAKATSPTSGQATAALAAAPLRLRADRRGPGRRGGLGEADAPARRTTRPTTRRRPADNPDRAGVHVLGDHDRTRLRPWSGRSGSRGWRAGRGHRGAPDAWGGPRG